MTNEAMRPGLKTPGLKARVIRAGSWIMGGQAVAQVLRLATNVFIARLLSPDAFGLMAVVYMLATALALFSDLGVGRTVVMSARGNQPDFLNTAWTINLIRTQGLALAVVVAAGVVAMANHLGLAKAGTVYADSRLPYLIAAFAVVMVIRGFEPIAALQARREMHLHTLTKIEIIGQVSSAVAMLLFAWIWHSIWALLVGAITASAVRCALEYLLLPGHVAKFRLDRESARELMGHAKWFMMSSILGFLSLNGDRVLLGGMITSRDFGLYSIAITIASILQTLAASVCDSIVFPALSEVWRDRPRELAKTFERFQWGYDGLVVFPAAMLAVAAPALIDVMYDSRYHDAGWMLRLISAGIVGLRYQVVEVGFLAVGNSKYGALATMLRLIALIAGMAVGWRFWGLAGAITGVALTPFAAWPLAIWFKHGLRVLTWRAEAVLVPAIASGLIIGAGLSSVLVLMPHRFGY